MNLIIEENLSGEIPVTRVCGCGNFSVAKTFDCGQTFRFSPVDGDPSTVRGTAFGRTVTFRQTDCESDSFSIIGSDKAGFDSLWRSYLDLDTDCAEADSAILNAMPTPAAREAMRTAVEYGSGIHILRQDPWETTVSFLVSQNNNIPRIRAILDRLCRTCAARNDSPNPADPPFPTPDDLIRLGEDGLFRLKTGYRAAYLFDAAVKFRSGEVKPDEIRNCPDSARCTEMISKIKGVGPKVAACILLFGFHKTEAFPVDVWMKRALARRFPNGFDPKPLGKWQGLAQQYLYYAERWSKDE